MRLKTFGGGVTLALLFACGGCANRPPPSPLGHATAGPAVIYADPAATRPRAPAGPYVIEAPPGAGVPLETIRPIGTTDRLVLYPPAPLWVVPPPREDDWIDPGGGSDAFPELNEHPGTCWDSYTPDQGYRKRCKFY
jgi:hypothetical protein